MWWPVTHAVIVTLTSLSDGRSARDIPKQHRSIKMGSLQQMAFGSQKVLWNVPKKFFALVSHSFAEGWTNGYCFRKGSVEGSANYSLLYLSPILMLGWKLRELFQYKSSLQKTIHHVVAVGVFFVEHKQSNGSVISCHWHCWLFRNHKANYLGCNRNHVNHVIFTISTCAVFVHQQSECQRRTKNGDILNISLRKSLVSGGWPSKIGVIWVPVNIQKFTGVLLGPILGAGAVPPHLITSNGLQEAPQGEDSVGGETTLW